MDFLIPVPFWGGAVDFFEMADPENGELAFEMLFLSVLNADRILMLFLVGHLGLLTSGFAVGIGFLTMSEARIILHYNQYYSGRGF